MIVLLGLTTPVPLVAEVYRCVDGAGEINYSDTRCSTGSQADQVKIQPNIYDASPDRKAMTQTKKQAALKPKKPAESQLGQPEADPASLINSAACRDAMRSYEIAAGSFEKDADEIASKNWQAEIKCGIPPKTRVGKAMAKKHPR